MNVGEALIERMMQANHPLLSTVRDKDRLDLHLLDISILLMSYVIVTQFSAFDLL